MSTAKDFKKLLTDKGFELKTENIYYKSSYKHPRFGTVNFNSEMIWINKVAQYMKNYTKQRYGDLELIPMGVRETYYHKALSQLEGYNRIKLLIKVTTRPGANDWFGISEKVDLKVLMDFFEKFMDVHTKGS